MVVSEFKLGLLAPVSMSPPTPLKETSILALSISSLLTHHPPTPYSFSPYYTNKTALGVSSNIHVTRDIARASLEPTCWPNSTLLTSLSCFSLFQVIVISYFPPISLLFLCSLNILLNPALYVAQWQELLFLFLLSVVILEPKTQVISFSSQFQL